MKRLTLVQFFGFGFNVGDLDTLRTHGLATLGSKSGKTVVFMDVNACGDFLEQRASFRNRYLS